MWLLAGPYPTHDAALAKVAADPFKHFAAIGTCSKVDEPRKIVFGTLEPKS